MSRVDTRSRLRLSSRLCVVHMTMGKRPSQNTDSSWDGPIAMLHYDAYLVRITAWHVFCIPLAAEAQLQLRQEEERCRK